jgi:hypothetical protein
MGIGWRDFQLFKENVRKLGIVMLSGMNDPFLNIFATPDFSGKGARLDELGPRPNHCR